jgi:manganese/iron transport system permease protein
MSWLTDPLAYHFMRTGLAAAILVGATCAVLGSYVVLRRMAFIGDAIAHTSVPGVAVAFLFKFNLFLGALIAGLLTALGIGWLSRKEAVREDTAIGVLFTGMFALGILIASTKPSFNFTELLFGHILGVTPLDLLLIAIFSFFVLAVLVLFHKELELTSVDPTYAAVVGLRADWMRDILLILLAMSVVTGIKVVGVILTSALLVTPAAAASLVTRSLVRMMLLAAIIAVSSGIIGLYISFYTKPNISASAAIVLTCTAWFAAAFLGRRLPIFAPPRYPK